MLFWRGFRTSFIAIAAAYRRAALMRASVSSAAHIRSPFLPSRLAPTSYRRLPREPFANRRRLQQYATRGHKAPPLRIPLISMALPLFVHVPTIGRCKVGIAENRTNFFPKAGHKNSMEGCARGRAFYQPRPPGFFFGMGRVTWMMCRDGS
jgi:hypothetical protein